MIPLQTIKDSIMCLSLLLGLSIVTPSFGQSGNLPVSASDLAGEWIAEGYFCESETTKITEKLLLKVDGQKVTATKLTGDNCVPAGKVTWFGEFLNDKIVGKFQYGDGTTFSMENVTISVVNADLLRGRGLTIRRKTDPPIDLSGLWLKSGGDVISISQTQQNITGVYHHMLSPKRVEHNKKFGWKIGDHRLKGSVRGSVLELWMRAHYPVDPYKAVCSEAIWNRWLRIEHVKLSRDKSKITGKWLSVQRNSESCKVVSESLREITLVRWPELTKIEIVDADDQLPIEDIAIGRSFQVRLTYARPPGIEIQENVVIRTRTGGTVDVEIEGSSRVLVSKPVKVLPKKRQ